MRKRTLALLIAGLFLFGFGAAACGDDDDSDSNDDASTSDEGDDDAADDGGDDDGGGSANADVQAYCDAVEEYAAQIDEAAESGDVNELSALSEPASELATQAAAIDPTSLTAEDGEAMTECTQVLSDAGERLVEAMTGG